MPEQTPTSEVPRNKPLFISLVSAVLTLHQERVVFGSRGTLRENLKACGDRVIWHTLTGLPLLHDVVQTLNENEENVIASVIKIGLEIIRVDNILEVAEDDGTDLEQTVTQRRNQIKNETGCAKGVASEIFDKLWDRMIEAMKLERNPSGRSFDEKKKMKIDSNAFYLVAFVYAVAKEEVGDEIEVWTNENKYSSIVKLANLVNEALRYQAELLTLLKDRIKKLLGKEPDNYVLFIADEKELSIRKAKVVVREEFNKIAEEIQKWDCKSKTEVFLCKFFTSMQQLSFS